MTKSAIDRNPFGYLWKGLLAGVCISMGGTIYLKVGGAAGACLFAFGLIAVVSLGLNLFTGKSQFVWGRDWHGYSWLAGILALNFTGCLAFALLVNSPAIEEGAMGIIDTRLSMSPLRAGLLAIGCGFIMTLAVQNAAKGKWLPLLFGIPAFILCGLPHCVADAFYICALPMSYLADNLPLLIPFYIAIVIGNFLGCNAYRLFAPGVARPGAAVAVTEKNAETETPAQTD